jgi:hypothetical protein
MLVIFGIVCVLGVLCEVNYDSHGRKLANDNGGGGGGGKKTVGVFKINLGGVKCFKGGDVF